MAIRLMGPLLSGFYLPKVLNEEREQKTTSKQSLYTSMARVLSAAQYTELCVLNQSQLCL